MAPLGLIAFTALIAAQFLSAIFAYRYSAGLPASQDGSPQGTAIPSRRLTQGPTVI